MDTGYGWKELYIAALRETDWSKMEGRIRAAEVGIKARLQELSMNHIAKLEQMLDDAAREHTYGAN